MQSIQTDPHDASPLRFQAALSFALNQASLRHVVSECHPMRKLRSAGWASGHIEVLRTRKTSREGSSVGGLQLASVGLEWRIRDVLYPVRRDADELHF